jgi:hypothetical protein
LKGVNALHKRSLVFLCLFLASFFACRLNAQQTLGSINGTVTDTSDAAIPGSTVTVSDAAINVTRITHSQGNGTFQVFNLPPGSYQVQVSHDGFDAVQMVGITVREAQATTANAKLKVGQISTSVEVSATSQLNATDSTNGYTLDSAQIAATPLATGSFTQLAVLSPGVNAELLSSIDSNAGLGNQSVWANGQRATSNTFQVNGVDVSNLFNGLTSSNLASQRWNFNIGEGKAIAGASQTSTSSYGSIGNSLPSPPAEMLQEMRVNTSSYDAQQGATSGAQIDANTLSGTNNFHGQVYGTFANNSMNAAGFFYKQDALLAQEGVGAFPMSLANPALHRWTTGATLGGPILKNKLYFFGGFQFLYVSDQSTGISQLNVPSGLTNDRSTTGINNALTGWAGSPQNITFNPIAMNLLQTQLPNGQYLIPSAQTSAGYAYGVPNVTLVGTSVMTGTQANGALDYDVTNNDRLSFKYFYQNDPVTKPFGVSETGGFPSSQNNGSQVGVLDNTIQIGSRLNWEQRIGFSRMGNYSYFSQAVTSANPAYGTNFGIAGATVPGYLNTNTMPGLDLKEFAADSSVSPALSMGPNSAFANTGFFQNRLNPSTNLIYTLGQHTFFFGGGYSYTQLNLENDRTGIASITSDSFEDFLEGETAKGSSVLDTIDPATGQNNANRYYRSNEFDGYAQDEWKARTNLTITAGLRYDYHGGLTEKYGNMFNFDPSAYNVTGTDTTGFDVINSGFVVAGNNKTNPSAGVSNSTLNGRQWGFSPRVGFAFAPKRDDGKFVISGGGGIYYDRGELFQYLSQPAGSGIGGPFGVTESAPLGSYVSSNTGTLGNPFGSVLPLTGTTAPPLPNSNPATMVAALQSQLNAMTATGAYGLNCGGAGDEEGEYCPAPLNFGAYDKNNVLPYVINYNLKMQWQPTNDLMVSIGYAGNRGRHSVIPIPFNEAQIATSSSPAMIAGASPHPGGETDTYGVEVLNQNSTNSSGDFLPIGSEPWSGYDGGNVDFRVPYVGYNPNAVLYETVGVSAYDALQAHIEKRLSHNYQFGANYTWSHSLDEQSDIGLFFTGNNPANLRSSWASSDFDRPNVFSGNFLAQLPDFAQKNSWLSYLTNDWNLTGIGVLQSGQPYSLYEYDGAVGSAYVGNYPSLMNPVLGVKNPSQVRTEMTGNKGAFRGAGGDYIPAIDPTQISLNYLAPGEKGVPTAAMGNQGDPLDTYETDFAPGDQRNIFRQSAQRRLDISFRKTVKIKDRVSIQYAFNIFNVTNTTSFDVPQNQTTIRQSEYACATGAMSSYDCKHGYTYGQVVTNTMDQATNYGRGSAGLALDQLPYVNGTGKSITVPTTIPVGTNSCFTATSSGGCPNNGADFGSVTGTIGGSRAITMGLHITY